MSLTVTQRPSITYEGDPSTWNALRNPVVYKMQRKDHTFNQINDNGGNIQLQFNAVDISAQFNVGNSVRVKSDNSVYDGIGLVTAKSFSTNTIVTIDIPYVGAAPGGFANLNTVRVNYRVEIETFNIANEQLNDVAFKFPANSNGELLIDVSKILRPYVLPDIDFDLTGSTQEFEDTAYTGFYIKYRETWTGSAESQTNDSANQFYAVLAAMQIPAPNGGNMAIYAIPETKFLTKLTTLVMWRGYPTLLGAIVNEDVASDVYIDTGVDNSTPADQSGKVVVYDLNQIIADQTIDETTVFVAQDTSAGAPITEELPVELREPCDEPVMLMGRNSLGGIIQWLFETNQDLSYEDNEGTKVKRMRLFADDLTLNQWEALQDFVTLGEVYRNNITELTSSTIKTSTRVDNQVYVVNADGTKIGVIVLPKTKSTDTRQIKHAFEIDIEYPEIFI